MGYSMNTKYTYDIKKYRFRELMSELYEMDELENRHSPLKI